MPVVAFLDDESQITPAAVAIKSPYSTSSCETSDGDEPTEASCADDDDDDDNEDWCLSPPANDNSDLLHAAAR